MEEHGKAPRVCLIDVVGLGRDHLDARMPRTGSWAQRQSVVPLGPPLPAVTSTAQADMLTGRPASEHGVVGNGWLFRDTREVRFWQQNHGLMQSESLLHTAARRAAERGRAFRSAQLFWWFNQGTPADLSLTPKPHYGSDGSKEFDVHGRPESFVRDTVGFLGKFPFPWFWGPMAGIRSSEWIADAAARTLREERPDLTLVYLPHLDYDPQRHGPTPEVMARCLPQVDACVATVLDACEETGTTPIVVSEYTLEPVHTPLLPNLWLRDGGWLEVRRGPFGEMLDLFECRAFAVCDHQIAHVYVSRPDDLAAVRARLERESGVAEILEGPGRGELDHSRSGELVLIAAEGHWFAYPYWTDDRLAPDFARTVDIHRKPGYDPCELFFDPRIPAPRFKAAWRLAQKKMGLRTRFDVVPLDPTLVKGSHGRRAEDPARGPVCIAPPDATLPSPFRARDVHGLVLGRLGLL